MGLITTVTKFLTSGKGTIWGAIVAAIVGGVGAVASAYDRSKRDKENRDLGAADQREKAQAIQKDKVENVNKAGDAAVSDIRSGGLRSQDGAKIPDDG